MKYDAIETSKKIAMAADSIPRDNKFIEYTCVHINRIPVNEYKAYGMWDKCVPCEEPGYYLVPSEFYFTHCMFSNAYGI